MRSLLSVLIILLAVSACRSERDAEPHSENIAVPEFIFQVDFGAPGAGEDFWFEWAEAEKTRLSVRNVRPVFDQNNLRMTLESCRLESPSRRCQPASAFRFQDRGEVSATTFPLVLRDGVVFSSDASLTFEDLPAGRYEIELFFHDAAAKEAGALQVEMQVGRGLVNLGKVEVSTGEDAAMPSRIQFQFNIVEAKPIRLLFRCIRTGYILNGFRLSKFFGGPTGPEPGEPLPPDNDKVSFDKPKLWTTEFGSFSLDSWIQPKGWRRFEESPRHLADVNGDGLADVVGFADYGVYVALSTGSSFAEPELWLSDFAPFAGNFPYQTLKPRMLADVNGDGLPDIVGFGNDGVYVALSSGSSFSAKQLWSADFSRLDGWRNTDYHPRWIADVDGDGLADIVAAKDDGIYWARSLGARFAEPVLLLDDFALNVSAAGREFNWWHDNHTPRQLFDLDGDGLADIAGFASEGLWTSLSTGQAMTEKKLTNSFFRVPNGWDYFQQSPRFAGHFGGVGSLADVIGFERNRRAVLVLDVLDQSAWFELPSLTDFIAQRAEFLEYEHDLAPIMVADVTGDGLDDVIFFLTDGTYVAVNRGHTRSRLITSDLD